MELVLPQFGLFFWSVILFLSIFLVLNKFAWPKIIQGIQEREKSIEHALQTAELARDEMKKLEASNSKLLEEARLERDQVLKEARAIGEKIVNEAKEKASLEVEHMTSTARTQIEAEKMAAITELKNEVGKLSISIAEKILRRELENPGEQEAVVGRLVNEMNLN